MPPRQQRILETKEKLAREIGCMPDPGSQKLAADIRAAVSLYEIKFTVLRVQPLFPNAFDRLKRAVNERVSAIDLRIQEKDQERARIDRTPADHLIWRLDENYQIALDLLRRRLPDTALAAANIEFSEHLLLPIENGLKSASRKSDKAQFELFVKSAENAAEVIESLQCEAISALVLVGQHIGLINWRVSQLVPFRAPEYGFIPLYANVDTYERVRLATQGAGISHSIRPRWLKKLIARLPTVGDMEFAELVGGISGHNSLTDSKRTAIRRELAAIGAEQRHRILVAALEQASAFQRELKSAVIIQTRDCFAAKSQVFTDQLTQLSQERRKVIDNWQLAERMLHQAEATAKDLLVLLKDAEREPCIA